MKGDNLHISVDIKSEHNMCRDSVKNLQDWRYFQTCQTAAGEIVDSTS